MMRSWLLNECAVLLAMMVGSCAIVRDSTATRYTDLVAVLCEWANNGIYYVSADRDEYGLNRFDTSAMCGFEMLSLNPDSSIACLAVSAPDSVIYLVRQPIEVHRRSLTNMNMPTRLLLREALEKSQLLRYSIGDHICVVETTLTEDCVSIIVDTLRGRLVLNTARYENVRFEYNEHGSLARCQVNVRPAIYTYEPLSKQCSMLASTAYALGLLPDGTLLMLRNDDTRSVLYRFSGEVDDPAMPIGELPWSMDWIIRPADLRLVPAVNLITWYSAQTRELWCWNFMSDSSYAIPVVSAAYCLSPNGKEIAYLLWSSKRHKTHVLIEFFPTLCNHK